MPDVDVATRLTTFFKIAFEEGSEGYVCIATRDVNTKAFHERFFHFPSDFEKMRDYCYEHGETHDVWFCPQLLSARRRTKDSVYETPSAWADLDTCDASNLKIPPSVLVQSSPGRYQALWRFAENDVAPIDAEDVSRRIAYAHAEQGADKSGWDLTQLLRVPYTRNHKYGDLHETPMVTITVATGRAYKLADFEVYEQVAEFAYSDIPYPDPLEIPDGHDVMHIYKSKLNGAAVQAFHAPPGPGEDWSSVLWQLELSCFESGLTLEQTFAVAMSSACNKYARDGRSPQYLWREVCRAWDKYQRDLHEIAPSPILDIYDPLLSEEEKQHCRNNPTFVENYIAWARTLGDAAWQYHQAGAFIILSSLLAADIKLPTSFGTVKPNMWFMILGDTTLTRKTTAMDIAMDLLEEVDDNAVLATDGSIEGLLAALATRPKRSSLFLRDEFAGLLEGMTKRDFLAGMMESFTKLYDGKSQKRILRRETIEVRDPVLLLFAGGIKSRILSLLSYEHVMTGFLPRFVFITAEADITKIRPVGPPTDQTSDKRDELVEFMRKLKEHFTDSQNITIDGNKKSVTKKIFSASMTPEAWSRYNIFEAQMVNSALNSIHKEVLMPTLDRLSKSGLKAAMLIAACRMESEVTITEEDIVRAFYYVEQWRIFALDVVANIGKSAFEKVLDAIENVVELQPGIYRGDLMRKLHLSAKTADDYLNTLEQRQVIVRKKYHKTERLFPIGAD